MKIYPVLLNEKIISFFYLRIFTNLMNFNMENKLILTWKALYMKLNF